MNPENNQPNTTPVSPQNALAPHHNAFMAALAYIGPLVLISYLMAKDDSFVKFHIKQGLVLLVIEVAVWVLGMVIWMIWPILQVINIFTLILAIIGIINAVKGAEKQLPLVGKYAVNFKVQ